MKNALVVVAVEVEEKKLGRVRFQSIPNTSAESLIPFVQDYVEPRSTTITDGWRGYDSLGKCGYNHEVKIIAGSNQKASEILPHVHLVVSLFKRWLMDTHQGAVSSVHLPFYLDEYAFRFNHRLSTYRGKLFYRLMQQAVITEATPLKKMFVSKQPRE